MIDFLVIGGGVAGLSAGARLSELGHVHLFEREEALAYHTSGRSAAMFDEGYGKTTTQALTGASRAFYEASEGILTPRGLMLVGSMPTADAFDEGVRGSRGTLAPISLDQALAMVPILRRDVVDRVAFNAAAHDIDTDLMLQRFARQIRQSGGTIATGHPISSIRRHGDLWQVQAGDRVAEAPVLVNAAGAWADEVAIMAEVPPIGMTPLRRSIARIAAPGGHDLSGWPLMLGAGEQWYAKPDAGALIVSPAEEAPMPPMDAWPEDMTLAEGLDRYQSHVTEPVTRPLASWAGLRTFAPDRQLVLGPDPLNPAFIWSAGQGGYGFQTAAAASALIRDLVAGRPPEIGAECAQALSPGRFR